MLNATAATAAKKQTNKLRAKMKITHRKEDTLCVHGGGTYLF